MLTALIERQIAELRTAMAAVDPRTVSGPDAARLSALFAEGRRLHASGETTFAHRTVETNSWPTAGVQSAPEWLAAQTGTGIGDAVKLLGAAQRLAELDEVGDAFRNGELSLPQAQAIADAASVDPQAQGELLDAARTGTSFKELKTLAGKVKHRARSTEDDEARHARHHAARKVTVTPSDDDGMGRLHAVLPPEVFGQVEIWLDHETDAVAKAARAEGRREDVAAHRADALVNLLRRGATGEAGAGPGRGLSSRLLLRVDAAALQRGFVEGDEVCDIRGVGPVPVAALRRLLPDCLIHILVTRGVDVTTVASVGRHVPVDVALALLWRDPTCVVPGCGRTKHLERDHWRIDYADGGPTSLDNLAHLCPRHHDDKTRNGARLERRPDGRWRWHPPPKFEDQPDPSPAAPVPAQAPTSPPSGAGPADPTRADPGSVTTRFDTS